MTLLEEIGAGTARGGAIDEYPVRRRSERSSCAGRAFSACSDWRFRDADVERILKGLGFQVRRSDAGWDVGAPTFRVDVLREVDLIEEVARHYGYDRLPSTFPSLSAPPAPSDPAHRARPARAQSAARRRLLGSADVFVHRCGRCRAVCRRADDRADRQSAVCAILGASAVAAARPARVGRAQPPPRARRCPAVRARRDA